MRFAIRSIARRSPEGALVTLLDRREIVLSDTRQAGMLIFVDGRQHPEYVPWTDIEQIHFDRPPRKSS